ncbi:MAG: hypothetical protein JRJ11_12285 [Deltaproteobacteria bacterium]|nr:hypothetical protein [Deltaproteobacteria bacterium]MBW1910302.1 hypothetical protein [Deltaproteobacteria bacterium]MBW2034300.1 hypothetical protein [Deltaproteobacteria bacterium]MBW2114632.1 hypothetical protein [Deltaproteobacteria bacterium]
MDKIVTGNVICMKIIPTKAIRVKEGQVAHIEGVYIYCGGCIRVYPKKTIRAVSGIQETIRYLENIEIGL